MATAKVNYKDLENYLISGNTMYTTPQGVTSTVPPPPLMNNELPRGFGVRNPPAVIPQVATPAPVATGTSNLPQVYNRGFNMTGTGTGPTVIRPSGATINASSPGAGLPAVQGAGVPAIRAGLPAVQGGGAPAITVGGKGFNPRGAAPIVADDRGGLMGVLWRAATEGPNPYENEDPAFASPVLQKGPNGFMLESAPKSAGEVPAGGAGDLSGADLLKNREAVIAKDAAIMNAPPIKSIAKTDTTPQPQGSGGMYLTSDPTKIYSAVGPATGGFGMREDLRQREVDLVAGREAAGAAREAEGVAKVAAEQAAIQKANDVTRIAQLQDVIRANMGNEFDGQEKIAAAQAELTTLTGQQALRQKESEASGKSTAEVEKARLGFKGLEAQAQAAKEAKIEAARITGDAAVEAAVEKRLGAKGKGAEKETEEQRRLAEAEVAQAVTDATATGTDVRTALGMRRAGMKPKLFGNWNPLQKNRTGWSNAEGAEVTQVPQQSETPAVSKSGRPIVYKNGVAYYAS